MSLWDRILASDPPLERLRLAARATLTLCAAGGLLLLLTRSAHLPPQAAVMGALIGMWATMATNDPDPAQRRITGLLVPLPAALTVTLAAFLERISPALATAAFPFVALVAVWVRRFGPRGFALGQIGLFGIFFSLFVQIVPPQLLETYVAMLVGAAVAFVVRTWIIPDDAGRALFALSIAFAARMRVLAAEAQRVVDGEREDPAEALRDQADALDAAALPIDALLAGEAFRAEESLRRDARVALIDAELAGDELALAARARVAGERPSLDDVRAHAVAALDRLTGTLRRVRRSGTTGRADAPPSPMPHPPKVGALEPTTRQAVQVAVATALAILLGTAIPPHQYFWAVFTTFIVYAGTASTAEVRGRTWGRTAGTAIGVAVGFALVALVKDQHLLEITLAIVALFLALYTFRISYTAFTFFITAGIAMVYDVIGRPTDQLLVARLVETAVGSCVGAVVATYVLPLRTTDVVAAVTREFVERLRASVGASADALLGKTGADPVDASRKVDAQMQELLARAKPLARSPDDCDAVRRCGYHARLLARRALDMRVGAEVARRLEGARAAIDGTLAAFETALERRPEIVRDDVAELRHVAEDLAQLATVG